jgi:hypothetical protein
MSLHSAIENAEKLLPGEAAPEGESDPRWQAIMDVAEFIPTHPDEVWEFAARWGCTENADLRDAIATCVLEHLLQHHFERVFTKMEVLAKADARFAETVKMCWKFGQAELPENSRRLDQLQGSLNAPRG